MEKQEMCFLYMVCVVSLCCARTDKKVLCIYSCQHGSFMTRFSNIYITAYMEGSFSPPKAHTPVRLARFCMRRFQKQKIDGTCSL
jgi:hypothetical protein